SRTTWGFLPVTVVRGRHGRAQGTVLQEWGSGLLPAGHQPRGERGPVVEDDAAGAAQVSLRVTTASAAAHSPGAHATTARGAGAGRCARGRGVDVVPGHADIMCTRRRAAPISWANRPRCGRHFDRIAGNAVDEPVSIGLRLRFPRSSEPPPRRRAPHRPERAGQPTKAQDRGASAASTGAPPAGGSPRIGGITRATSPTGRNATHSTGKRRTSPPTTPGMNSAP